MTVLRTPDERFENLPQWNYQPHYNEVDGLRIHYIDEGSSNKEVVLLMHGEPSWAYIYRKMIPIFLQAGLRVVAPDFVGFGRSDKLSNISSYSYKFHVDTMTKWLQQLDLKNITIFGQDWGGLIGLRLATENVERFSRIVAANTFLPTGDHPVPEIFFQWKEFCQTVPELPVGRIVERGCKNSLSAEEVAAYDAPFPDESYKAGARAFPGLVPISPNDPAVPDNRAAWEVLTRWEKPFLTLFSDSDPITRGADKIFQALVPGASTMPHKTIKNAAHFLQEDNPEEVASSIVELISTT
ncbi:MAG: haloalkane dehalogenase [Blastocatellia bacterium]|nr:haloalkane dehalogenase [Blastocatellia bacterium]